MLRVDVNVFTDVIESCSSACPPQQVCDEGHRLKSAGGNQTIKALVALRATRRILLTGTPLQNNLDEVRV